MKAFFLSLLEISATMGIIILIIALFSSFADKKFTAKWKYWIWLFIAFRLIMPFTPEIDAAPPKIEVAVPDKVIYTEISAPSSDSEHIAVPHVRPDHVQAETSVSITVPSEAQNEKKYTVLDILGTLWFFGGAAFFTWYVGAYFIFRKKILSSVSPSGDGTKMLLEKVKTELQIKNDIVPLISEDVKSPMVMGFIRPRLILPDENFNETELYFILRHELTHYKRKDTLYKALLLFANTVHWFNPAVWYMRKTAGTDLELSCDAFVVKDCDIEARKRYSETILACVHREKTSCNVFSTHFYGGVKTLKKRFANILSTEKKRKGIIAFICVLIAAAVLGSTASCSASYDEPTGKEIEDLLKQADMLYQPGNLSLFKTGETSMRVDGHDYLKIENFYETAAKVFTEKATYELKNTVTKYTLIPYFVNINEEIYKISDRLFEKSTLYYSEIEWIKLVDNHDNRFTYRVAHSSESSDGSFEVYSSDVVIVNEKGTFLIDEFDSKRTVSSLDHGTYKTFEQTISEEDIIDLIKKAEAIYQPGNTEVFELKENEVKPLDYPYSDVWYNEIKNYEEAVHSVFTSRAQTQLENAYKYSSLLFSPIVEQFSPQIEKGINFDFAPPLIVKKRGKVYRISEISDNPSVTFYDKIHSVDLIESNGNFYTYEITHTGITEKGEEIDCTSRVDFYFEEGYLVINDFFSHLEISFNEIREHSNYGEKAPWEKVELTGKRILNDDIKKVNEAFISTVLGEDNIIYANPLACFLTCTYESPAKMNLALFLYNFPSYMNITDEAEFEALKEYWGDGGNTSMTLNNYPVPLNKYPVSLVDETLEKYMGIKTADLDCVKNWNYLPNELDYLAEYESFYNTTSDWGLNSVEFFKGEILGDGTVKLYSYDMVLTLIENEDRYLIYSYMPI